MADRKIKAYCKGLWAEFLAAWLLRLKGWRILTQRYKCRYGEIDIIARRGNHLIFVEVKARRKAVDALESVTVKNRVRVERAAQWFISQNPDYAGYDMRFDVVTFVAPFLLSHLDNAWRPRS